MRQRYSQCHEVVKSMFYRKWSEKNVVISESHCGKLDHNEQYHLWQLNDVPPSYVAAVFNVAYEELKSIWGIHYTFNIITLSYRDTFVSYRDYSILQRKVNETAFYNDNKMSPVEGYFDVVEQRGAIARIIFGYEREDGNEYKIRGFGFRWEHKFRGQVWMLLGFPGGSDGKESACNVDTNVSL